MWTSTLLACLAAASVVVATAHTCPPKGTNASCAAVGGCGHWCDDVCSCDSSCASHSEGCCYDQKSCPPGPPGPPSPSPHPHPYPPSPSPPPTPTGPTGGPEQTHLALGPNPTQMVVDFATARAFGNTSVCERSLVGPDGSFDVASVGVARTYTDGGWQGQSITI